MRLSDLIVANLRDALILNPVFPLRHVAAALGFRELHLNIRGFGKVYFRTNDSDAVILRQIFRDRDYDLMDYPHGQNVMAAYRQMLHQGDVPVIIDAGANIGGASRWFATAFPDAVTIAVEPVDQNVDLCRRNLAHLPNVRVVQGGIGATSGRGTIVDTGVESWAFQTERDSKGSISFVTIPELVASVPNGRLFAAKIDVEGFEADLFSENTAWIDDLKFLFIEPHDWMLPWARTSQCFQKRLAQSEFDMIVAGENLLYVSNREMHAPGGPVPHRTHS